MFGFLKRKPQPQLPDWRTDSLYRLVFQKVETEAWKFCRHNTDSEYWQYVLIEEWSSAEYTQCSGHLLRAWVRNARGLKQIPLWVHSKRIGRIRDSIFPFVIVSFYLDSSRNYVVYCQREAHTAGHGERYRVTGTSDNPELVGDPSGGFWIS